MEGGSPTKAEPHLLKGVLKERLPRDADLHVAGEGVGLGGRKGCEGPAGCPGSPPSPADLPPAPKDSHGKGSGTGETSSESSGHKRQGSPPAYS